MDDLDAILEDLDFDSPLHKPAERRNDRSQTTSSNKYNFRGSSNFGSSRSNYGNRQSKSQISAQDKVLSILNESSDEIDEIDDIASLDFEAVKEETRGLHTRSNKPAKSSLTSSNKFSKNNKNKTNLSVSIASPKTSYNDDFDLEEVSEIRDNNNNVDSILSPKRSKSPAIYSNGPVPRARSRTPKEQKVHQERDSAGDDLPGIPSSHSNSYEKQKSRSGSLEKQTKFQGNFTQEELVKMLQDRLDEDGGGELRKELESRVGLSSYSTLRRRFQIRSQNYLINLLWHNPLLRK